MIHITPAASGEMRRLLFAQGRRGWGLRVGVKGGGCSGLSYTMEFEEKSREHDKVFEAEGVSVFCDPKSYLYLNELTLDYTNELIGGGFKFLNPNATRTCSCGSSFSA
jgi:iron-sulfur cluster assembly protein